MNTSNCLNKKQTLRGCVVSTGGHSDGGGAECREERGAEETVAGGAGPTERGGD